MEMTFKQRFPVKDEEGTVKLHHQATVMPDSIKTSQHEPKTTTSLTVFDSKHWQSGAILHLAIYLRADTDHWCANEQWARNLFKDKQSKPTERRQLINCCRLANRQQTESMC